MLRRLPHIFWPLLLRSAITLPSHCDTYLCHLLWSCHVPQYSSHTPCAGAEISWSLLHQKRTHEHLPKRGIGEKIGILWTNLVPCETGIDIPNPTHLTSINEIPALYSRVVSKARTCFLVFHPHVFCVLWGTWHSVLQGMHWFPC